MKKIMAADLYCGAGGTTSGLFEACRRLGFRLDLLAVNHWAVAISTHTRNHPDARQICWAVDALSPKRCIPGGKLDLLVASPECTHHSIARGGMPVSDQKRAGAWEVQRWATELRIDDILVENVREFESWGPVGANRRPIQSRKGETFRAWVKALESLNYRVEWRVLNCADFGDPTSRKRLFIRARRGNGHIEWPKPTHAERAGAGLQAWHTAREIIDWTVHGRSIFNRERPLKARTIERIAAGLRKFGGAAAEPFLVMLYGNSDVKTVDRPLPTVTAGGGHVGLCEPFLLDCNHGSGVGYRVHGLDGAVPTLTANKGLALCEPFILPQFGGSRARSVERPLGAITTDGGAALIEPFLVNYHGNHSGRMDGMDRVDAVDAPLRTVDCSNRYGLCEPFLIKYYRTGKTAPIGEPLHTVTTKDRFRLVEPAYLDILYRMLEPHELAAAMGFPEGYQFLGTKSDVVKQIGNAVPTNTAEALAEAALAA
jgi:DNA (cytosine-5)-methyltransferase 1